MVQFSALLLLLGLSLAGAGCWFFRKPGVRFGEAVLRVFWFSDPVLRLHRPGVILQWLGLLAIIGAGLILLLWQRVGHA